MAYSNITKKALAAALKELMAEVPFSKISISDICSKCSMNRKSFYYHFKDKYDLVNWIYDTEFIAIAHKKNYEASWDLTMDILVYLYENRTFYRKALNIEGQNSFAEHFHDIIRTIISHQMQKTIPPNNSIAFQVDFFTDAFVLSIYKWITSAEPMTPDEFIKELKLSLLYISEIYEEIEKMPEH